MRQAGSPRTKIVRSFQAKPVYNSARDRRHDSDSRNSVVRLPDGVRRWPRGCCCSSATHCVHLGRRPGKLTSISFRSIGAGRFDCFKLSRTNLPCAYNRAVYTDRPRESKIGYNDDLTVLNDFLKKIRIYDPRCLKILPRISG